MRILAIDPGTTQSAFMLFDKDADNPIIEKGIMENGEMILTLFRRKAGDFGKDHLVIESIASYGMPVGKEVFATCIWIGRFIQAFLNAYPFCPWSLLARQQIKLTLCKSARAKDANVRQALIDIYGPPGTKKNPGVTYGVSKDLWSALAIAHVASDIVCFRPTIQ